MPDETITITTSTDSQSVATAAANNDADAARVPVSESGFCQSRDGSAISWEHPESERRLLMQRLAEAEKDAALPIEEEAAADEPAQPETESTEPPAEPEAVQPVEPLVATPAFATRLEQMRESNPEDIEAIAGSATPIPTSVAAALVQSPVGPDLIAWLARNPDVAGQLASMPERTALEQTWRALAVREWQMSHPPVPRSAAPAPIKPLRGSPTSRAMSLDDPNIDFQTYKRMREREIKSRRLQ